RRFLIKNGVAKPQAFSARKTSQVLNILTIGRLSPVKNHALLLNSLAYLDFPFHAKIIGEGECRPALEQQIKTLKLEDSVTLLGEVTDARAYLQAADVFVLSSDYEGLPLSILEAMSYQLPVVATDVGGVSEAVLHGETGLLSSRGDAGALSQNLMALAQNPLLAKDFGHQGWAHYAKQFTAERMIAELELVYQAHLKDTQAL
ncbi:MAG: glycosyltransferase, partial [Arenicellales bacterium]